MNQNLYKKCVRKIYTNDHWWNLFEDDFNYIGLPFGHCFVFIKHLCQSNFGYFFLPGCLDRNNGCYMVFWSPIYHLFLLFFQAWERERKKKQFFKKSLSDFFPIFFSASPVNFPFGKTSPFLSVMSWERRRRRRGKRRKCAQGKER